MSWDKKLDQDYGKNLRGLSKKLSHDMPLLKMLPICAISGLTKLSRISGRSGMLANGILYQLAPLVPAILGRESGLLPIPTAQTYGSSQDGAAGRLPTPTCRDSGNPLPPRKSHPGGGQKPPLVSVIGGKLNPQFVEWMMGYPEDWTKVEKSE